MTKKKDTKNIGITYQNTLMIVWFKKMHPLQVSAEGRKKQSVFKRIILLKIKQNPVNNS